MIAGFLVPHAALAQDVGANASRIDVARIAVTTVRDESVDAAPADAEPSDPAEGWAVLGGQLGLGVAITGMALASELTGDRAWMYGTIGPAMGLIPAGAFSFHALARSGEWNAGLGWALAALVPAAFYGSLAGAFAMLVSRDVQREPSAALAISASLGAALGAPLFGVLGSEGLADSAFRGWFGGFLGGVLLALPLAFATGSAIPVLASSFAFGAGGAVALPLLVE